MTPSRIANKLRGECSYHTPIGVVLSTKKLGFGFPWFYLILRLIVFENLLAN
jgi:hypothetical protein